MVQWGGTCPVEVSRWGKDRVNFDKSAKNDVTVSRAFVVVLGFLQGSYGLG